MIKHNTELWRVTKSHIQLSNWTITTCKGEFLSICSLVIKKWVPPQGCKTMISLGVMVENFVTCFFGSTPFLFFFLWQKAVELKENKAVWKTLSSWKLEKLSGVELMGNLRNHSVVDLELGLKLVPSRKGGQLIPFSFHFYNSLFSFYK